jgi:hypothetical protein
MDLLPLLLELARVPLPFSFIQFNSAESCAVALASK